MCPVTAQEAAYFDRIDDAIDAYACDQITREEFIKRLREINIDHFEAQWRADQIKPQQAAE
jgi:hypothetical protein